MCGVCGCSDDADLKKPETNTQQVVHAHNHKADHLVQLEIDILSKNNNYAENNRRYLNDKKSLALNIMSSPGSGKTTLLAKTMAYLRDKVESAVIVGDQQTDYDALKIHESGGKAIQINTGKTCHLDAHMVGHAMEKLAIKNNMILFIENIGNLVCPSLFHLGENYKVVILSVTEGDNKPLKYPDMFHCADLMILTKLDLLPYVDFDIDQCITYARRVNPAIAVLTMSATKNQGLEQWYDWLLQKQKCL